MIEQTATGVLNGVTTVPALTATARTVVRDIVINNKDTANVTVIVSIGTEELWSVTLQPGDVLHCDDIYVLQYLNVINIVLAGAITTSNPRYVITYATVE